MLIVSGAGMMMVAVAADVIGGRSRCRFGDGGLGDFAVAAVRQSGHE